MKIVIINGPNLNLVGRREPELYGNQSFEDFLESLKAEHEGITLQYFQSNVEGELVDLLQRHGFDSDGIVLNAGAYTHTSIAIGDAVAAIDAPVVEVHISNIFAREEFRKFSYLSKVAIGSVSGLGLNGYRLAMSHLIFLNSSKLA